MTETMDVTLRLNRGQEGLDDLLDGVFACATWLVKNRDGTYSLNCGGVARDDDTSEAYLRVLLDRTAPEGEVDWPATVAAEPTPEVRALMESLRVRLGWNGDRE